MTEDEIRTRIGLAIKSRREWIGESQAFIAKKFGMSEDGYRHWENGSRMPTIFTLYRLAKVLRCPLAELLPSDIKVD